MSAEQVADHNVQVTWRTVLPVWWLLCWRGATLSIGATFLAPYLDDYLLEHLLRNPSFNPTRGLAIYLAVVVFGFLLMVAVGFVIVQAALKKQYAGFRIALISN